jgi:hypothetical protein
MTYIDTVAYTIRVNGTGRQRLRGSDPFEEAAWAPDSRRVALLTENGVFIRNATARGMSRLVYRLHLTLGRRVRSTNVINPTVSAV